MHASAVNLQSNTRQEVINLLSKRLVDAIDLHAQTKLSHWNVRGKHFYTLHLLFDKVAEIVEEATDLLAERIGQLGGAITSNLQGTAEQTSLPKFNTAISEGMDVVKQLTLALTAFTNAAREDIDASAELGDAVTSDILTSIVRDLDQQTWFIDAHLQ